MAFSDSVYLLKILDIASFREFMQLMGNESQN